MKFKDINARFTEKVHEYLHEGYVFNTTSMSGHQGEVCKVDLVKDNEFIRIWINQESNWNAPFHGNMMVLRVSKWQYPAERSCQYTVWNSELDHIEEYTFYQLDRSDWYTEDFQEAMDAQNLRYSRYHNQYPGHKSQETTDRQKEIGAKYLKRKAGYQRIRKDEIKIQKANRIYHLVYAGKTYRIK